LLAVTVHGNTVAGAILQQYAYGYDASGNRTTEQIGAGSSVAISQSSYNADNQLTGRVGGSGQMLFAGSLNKPGTVKVAGSSATMNNLTTNFFGYTSVTNGTNVIPVTATDYSANSATNKYQVIVTNNGVAKTLTFDLNGNETSVVTSTSTNTYQWDAANRLVSITGATNQSLFTYNGFGKRIQIIEKTNGVAYVTNRYVWCGAMLCEQRNNTGSTVTKRYFDQGEQISGTNYFFTKDHLGSIREMVDGAGTIQARYNYDPYGRRIKISGSLDADFAYAGYYYHSASGLYLTFFRAYDADLGRWLSRDPLAERVGLNLYDYVLNNPFNWLDPYGACGGSSGASEVEGGAGELGAGEGAAGLGLADIVPIAAAGYAGWEAGTWLNNHTPIGNLGTWLGNLITPLNPAPPNSNVSLPPVVAAGIWPLPQGARRWAQLNDKNPLDAQNAAHDIKDADLVEGKNARDYGVDPETGDVTDPNGEVIDNLNDCL
jgi:RHS repeat-associated protein